MNFRRAVLPHPQSLFDIVEKGAEHEAYSNVCLYELIKQLKRQIKYPVLIAIGENSIFMTLHHTLLSDNWNAMFNVSKYVSIRYDLTKFNGYIPGYHLAIPRLFSKWDGDQFKRGQKNWDRRIGRE